MNNFLESVSEDIYNINKDILKDTIVVFPNKRSGLFFKKHLGNIKNQTTWLPKVTTLSDFINNLSGYETADNLTLIFKLYNIYQKYMHSKEDFDSFYYWGEMILNDFDDIDKYIVNPKDIFSNLKDIKTIGNEFQYLSEDQIKVINKFWSSFKFEKLSDAQNDFINLWDNLYNIYTDFKQELQNENICYEGMAYRSIYENLKKNKIQLNCKKIIMVGFNALNKCEEEIFDHFQTKGIIDFYWDYDQFYMNNFSNEAGFYMRKNIKRFPNKLPEEEFNSFNKTKKDINIYSIPSDIGQCKILASNLKEIDNNRKENTAVVLGDESLLIPTLYSIPSNIDAINVTMGYPAQNSTITGFIKSIIELQDSIKINKNECLFFYKPLITLLNHQFLCDENTISDINEIQKENKIYVGEKDLKCKNKIESILKHPKTGYEAGNYLISILHDIFQHINIISSEENNIKLEKEYLFNIYTQIKRINSIVGEYNINLRPKTYYKIISKIIKGLTIPFEGEPLAGLQVMGLMETRLLDFKYLNILSCNEGKLPKSSAGQSYIPYNLRKGFGLPTLEHQDSMFAYYFYRLIQRADNINFYYSTRRDGIRTGEMSRFLYQLKYESIHNIKEYNITNEIGTISPVEISIKKDDEIIKEIDKITSNEKRPLSPSAINTYRTCKLKFYFQYIKRLKEKDEIIDSIDNRIFGLIYHDSMEKIYKPYIGQELKNEDFDNIIKNKTILHKHLSKAFSNNYFEDGNSKELEGEAKILYNVIFNYIIQTLKKDKTLSPIKILETENRHKICLNVLDKKRYIGGIIDRVDETEHSVRIIDYKTGSDELKIDDIETFFTNDFKKENKAALQTLIYSFIYDCNNQPNKQITPGIYNLKQIFSKDFDSRFFFKEKRNTIYINNFRTYKGDIEDFIKNTIKELLDINTRFEQCEIDNKACTYCSYKDICHR
ncbi:PD-(D/E)XK nuclease family protein [Marinilabiliaceae bacterium JC040]|nr:PD-(D/E)XK nuclease family protein [Marinilabiliaceae bacterium JC040]